MKKTIYICFAMLVAVISVINFINFSIETNEAMYRDLQQVTITKPDYVSNKEFINELKAVTADNNTDIMTKKHDLKSNTLSYYKTNNSNDFLDISVEGNSLLLEDKDCISTAREVKGYNVIHLYMTTQAGDTSIYSLDEAEDFDLSSGEYYLQPDKCDIISDILANKNYKVQPFELPFITTVRPIFSYALCPMLLTFVAILFYFSSKSKEDMLKKLDGYSNLDIIKAGVLPILKNLILIFLGIQAVNLIVFQIQNSGMLLRYISFTITSGLAYYLGAILCVLVLSSGFVFIHNGTAYIKGKDKKRFILIINIVVKVCSVIFLSASMIIPLLFLPSAIGTYCNAKAVSEALSPYVSPRLYGSESDVSSEKANDRYKQFYYSTVDAFHGVFIDTTGYVPTELGTPVPEYIPMDDTRRNFSDELLNYISFNNIIINKNYLDLNPILKTNGEPITAADFDSEKINILLSDKETHTDEIVRYEKYMTPLALKSINKNTTDIDVNVIYYKADQLINLYQPSLNNDLDASRYAVNPIIKIFYDDMDLEYFSFSICNNYYLLETKTDDPYNELLPVITECGLDNTIQEVAYASENYDIVIKDKMLQIIYFLIQALLYGLLFLLVTVSYIKIYLHNNRDIIAAKKLAGQSFFSVYKIYFYLMLGMFIITEIALLLIYTFFNGSSHLELHIGIPIAIYLLELILFRIMVCKYTRKSILEILKGN